jgi:hypothetical protein
MAAFPWTFALALKVSLVEKQRLLRIVCQEKLALFGEE